MKKSKAAVVGLGIGMAHVAGYLDSPYAELYAVCDLLPGRLNMVGGTFALGSMLSLKPLFQDSILGKKWEDIGVKTFTDLDELLSDPQIEIVSLCTPDYLHAEHAEKVINAGKHLLMEKPLDINLNKANRISETILNANVSFGLGYEFRVNPAILMLKSFVDQGRIGQVKGFSLYHFRTPFRRDKWNNWIQSKECSGGLIVEETCHWLDLARFVTGKEIESIHSVTEEGILPEVDFENIAYINGTYHDGGVFQISHVLTGFDFSLQLVVHGTKSTAWCSLKEAVYSALDDGKSDYLGLVCIGKPDIFTEEVERWIWGWEATEPWNIRDLVIGFTEKVLNGMDQAAGIHDGIESLRWALLANQSAVEKRVIRRE